MLIESTQNAAIKALAKLSAKKERDKTGTFLVEGLHMLEEAHAAGLLEKIYALSGLPHPDYAEVIECSQPVLNKLSSQKSDAKYIGLCHFPRQQSIENFDRLLILDGVQDPGNVGTLIRSAYSFGAQGVLLSSACADPYSPKALQSTQGALFHLPVWRMDLTEIIPELKKKDIQILGAALHQQSIELHTLQIPARWGLIIGSEGQGISAPVLDLCDVTVFIEMAQFESLNAAVAGSILLYSFQFAK